MTPHPTRLALGLPAGLAATLVARVAAGCASALLAAPSAAGQIVLEPPRAFDGGALVGKVFIADLNEDGLPDVLAGHERFIIQPLPALLPGVGDGTLGPAQSLPVGAIGTDARALADFDGDGHLDLLAASAGSAPPLNVTVWRGVGDGSFGAPVGINGNFQSPTDADVGDFNGDGKPDVVIANSIFGFSSGAIVVVLGNGDGTFGAPATIATGIGASGARARAGDLNGDGFDDVVFTGSSAGSVRLSLGNGSFSVPTCAGCPLVTEFDYLLADLDHDGDDDVLTPTRSLHATLDGTLQVTQSLPPGSTPVAVAAGDLDGDGETDAVIGRNVASNLQDPTLSGGDLVVLRGNGDGTFQTPGLVLSHVPQPRGVAVGDLDLDGRPDVVAGSYVFFATETGTVRTVLNHTYGPGSPFLDLGGVLAGLPGSNGAPIQLADGTLVAGQPFEFTLANGPAGGAVYHFVGLAALNLPFKGGLMIPSVNLVNGPLPLDASGGITLAGPWPGGAEGLSLYLQFWMPNGGGPAGFVASSGVRAQVP